MPLIKSSWSWNEPDLRQEFYMMMATTKPGTKIVLRGFPFEWNYAEYLLRWCRVKWNDDKVDRTIHKPPDKLPIEKAQFVILSKFGPLF